MSSLTKEEIKTYFRLFRRNVEKQQLATKEPELPYCRKTTSPGPDDSPTTIYPNANDGPLFEIWHPLSAPKANLLYPDYMGPCFGEYVISIGSDSIG